MNVEFRYRSDQLGFVYELQGIGLHYILRLGGYCKLRVKNAYCFSCEILCKRGLFSGKGFKKVEYSVQADIVEVIIQSKISTSLLYEVNFLDFIFLCDKEEDVLIWFWLISKTSSNIVSKFMDAWLWVTLVSKIMQEYFNDKLSIFEVTYIIRYFYLSFNNILVSCLDIRNFIHIRGTNFLSPAIKGKLNLRSIEIINLAFTESQLCHSMLPAYYLSRFVFQCNDNFRSLSL